MQQTFTEAALAKEDIIDIVNIGIETLVRHNFEMPAFETMVREARVQRVAANQVLHARIYEELTAHTMTQAFKELEAEGMQLTPE